MCFVPRAAWEVINLIKLSRIECTKNQTNYFSFYVVSFSAPPSPPPFVDSKIKEITELRRKAGRTSKTTSSPHLHLPFLAQGLDLPLSLLIKYPQDGDISWRKFSLSAFGEYFCSVMKWIPQWHGLFSCGTYVHVAHYILQHFSGFLSWWIKISF